jgi:hypothetical protein
MNKQRRRVWSILRTVVDLCRCHDGTATINQFGSDGHPTVRITLSLRAIRMHRPRRLHVLQFANGRSAMGRIHKRDASRKHRASLFRSPPFNRLNLLPTFYQDATSCRILSPSVGNQSTALEEADKWMRFQKPCCWTKWRRTRTTAQSSLDLTVNSHYWLSGIGRSLRGTSSTMVLEAAGQRAREAWAIPRATIKPSRRMRSEGNRPSPAHVRRTLRRNEDLRQLGWSGRRN